jgi:hypothetical protein
VRTPTTTRSPLVMTCSSREVNPTLGLALQSGLQLAAAMTDLRQRVGEARGEIGPLQLRIDHLQHRRDVAARLRVIGGADQGSFSLDMTGCER